MKRQDGSLKEGKRGSKAAAAQCEARGTAVIGRVEFRISLVSEFAAFCMLQIWICSMAANGDLQFGRKWRFAVLSQMAICSLVANGDLQSGRKWRFAVRLQILICSLVANVDLQWGCKFEFAVS